jgi:phosphoglycerate dehydrogenase-like enzyme
MGNEQGVSTLNAEFPFPMMTNCRIVIVGPRNGDDSLLELAQLPRDARILATGKTLEELRTDGNLFAEGNVILNISGDAKTLAEIIDEMPFLVWIHSITAGIDHILCPQIVDNDEIILTNARGVFSSSLAEYVIGAIMHFAKCIPRLIQQQRESKWEKFCVTEIRGKTLGIIGYGNIGHAVARVAKPFGMNVLALRKNPSFSHRDSNVDEVVGIDQLDYVLEQSDYVVVVLALTPVTRHFIKAKNLQKAKRNQILINIGRGALIDEDALIQALEEGWIAGAALDVFTVEPLPPDSKLWQMENVLISPHNADSLTDSRHKSVRLFVENCKKFLADEDLDCIVDKKAGY